VIKFVSDLRQVGSRFSPVSSTNKTDRHDITEILLKVVLNQYPAMARRKETEINAKYDLKVGNHQTNKQTNKQTNTNQTWFVVTIFKSSFVFISILQKYLFLNCTLRFSNKLKFASMIFQNDFIFIF
jgi:hypothetical protein